MYKDYENHFKIVFDEEVPNGLPVCVWRDIDNDVWEVSVIEPKNIWDSQYDERFREIRRQQESD